MAAVDSAPRRLSAPQLLAAASVASYGLVFALMLVWGRPGLGLGQGFYVAIILAGLAAGPREGALAGLVALVLYDTALLASARIGVADLASATTAIRLVSYVSAGLLVGHVATRGRRMLAESLHVLEDLLAIARRDGDTGTFTPAGLEGAIHRRLALRGRFALLVGEAGGDPRAVTRSLAAQLGRGDDLAHLGGGRFAVLTLASTPDAACALCAGLEHEDPGRAFGWALHPDDGADALSLYGAALERLYARR